MGHDNASTSRLFRVPGGGRVTRRERAMQCTSCQRPKRVFLLTKGQCLCDECAYPTRSALSPVRLEPPLLPRGRKHQTEQVEDGRRGQNAARDLQDLADARYALADA